MFLAVNCDNWIKISDAITSSFRFICVFFFCDVVYVKSHVRAITTQQTVEKGSVMPSTASDAFKNQFCGVNTSIAHSVLLDILLSVVGVILR